MTGRGFEPRGVTSPELESGALDRSATLSFTPATHTHSYVSECSRVHSVLRILMHTSAIRDFFTCIVKNNPFRLAKGCLESDQTIPEIDGDAATVQHGDAAAVQHGDAATVQHGDAATVQHGDAAANPEGTEQHRNKTTISSSSIRILSQTARDEYPRTEPLFMITKDMYL